MSVSVYRDSVTDDRKFFQSVRYIDNTDSFGSQIFDDLEHVLDLVIRKRSCRFIHDQNFQIIGKCLGDFYHLFLSYAQSSYDCFRFNVLYTQTVQNLLSFLIHSFPVCSWDWSQVIIKQFTHINVFCYRYCVDQRKFLIYSTDSFGSGIKSGFDIYFLSIQVNISFITGISSCDNFDQCTLTCSVCSYQGMYFTLIQFQLRVLQGSDSAEPFCHMFRFQYNIRHVRSLLIFHK